jgi:hypothetical protein
VNKLNVSNFIASPFVISRLFPASITRGPHGLIYVSHDIQLPRIENNFF